MAVHERLSLDSASAERLVSAAELQRHEVAASLCGGLRVLLLECGSGQGASVLASSAVAVTAVDADPAAVRAAAAAAAPAEGDARLEFRVSEPLAALEEPGEDVEAIVWVAGPGPGEAALEALAAQAAGGRRLVVALELGAAGFESAIAALSRFDGVALLHQFAAEGSLVRPAEGGGDVQGRLVLEEHGEPEHASHLIACVNFGVPAPAGFARMDLAVAPVHERMVRQLEEANRDLWRVNANLARGVMGKADSAAASYLSRSEAELAHARERWEYWEDFARQADARADAEMTRGRGAEAREEELMATVAELEHRIAVYEAGPLVRLDRVLRRVVRFLRARRGS